MLFEQDQAAADGVDRDVQPAVIVVVRHSEPPADDEGQGRRAAVRELSRRALCGPVLEHLDRLRVPAKVPDRDRAVGEDEVRIAVEVEVAPGDAPARERTAEGGGEAGASVGKRGAVPARRQPVQDRVLLAARVADEEIGQAVAVRVGVRNAHAGVRIGGARAGGPLLEAEAEPGRVCPDAARPGDVLVQPVRILVVGDVQVEAAVSVEIREDGAEGVVEAGHFEACLTSDLAKAPAAAIEVEQVAHARVAAGKPALEPGIGAFTSVYPPTKRSGRPSPFTSPTAADVRQPDAATPAAAAPSRNDPLPAFQSSAETPAAVT